MKTTWYHPLLRAGLLASLLLAAAPALQAQDDDDDVYATPSERRKATETGRSSQEARRYASYNRHYNDDAEHQAARAVKRDESNALPGSNDDFYYSNRINRFGNSWAYQGSYMNDPFVYGPASRWAWGNPYSAWYNPMACYSPVGWGAGWGTGIGWSLSIGNTWGNAWGNPYGGWGYGGYDPFWDPYWGSAYAYSPWRNSVWGYGRPVVVVNQRNAFYNPPRAGTPTSTRGYQNNTPRQGGYQDRYNNGYQRPGNYQQGGSGGGNNQYRSGSQPYNNGGRGGYGGGGNTGGGNSNRGGGGGGGNAGGRPPR